MRPFPVWRTLVIGLLLGFISQTGFARLQSASTPPAPVRDPQAVAVLQSAITAMGGAASVGAIQSSVAQGTSVASADASSVSSFIWSHSGQDFRYENNAATGSHVFVSNAGNPCDIEGNAVVFSPAGAARATVPFDIPALALYTELNNSNYTITFVGATTLNGLSAIHVQTADNSDSVGQLVTPQDWYFDGTTGLPLSVQYRIPGGGDAQNWQPGSINFANFQNVNGVLVPFQLTIQEGPAGTSIVATMSSVTFNTTIGSTACLAPVAVGSAQ